MDENRARRVADALRDRGVAPSPASPLMREGGLFRRFRGGFRYDSE